MAHFTFVRPGFRAIALFVFAIVVINVKLRHAHAQLTTPCTDWKEYTLSPRSSHAMTFDTKRGVAVLFGGGGYQVDGQTWEWDGTDWTLVSTSGPSPRGGAHMVFDEIRKVSVLYGGSSHDDTWEWDGSTWAQRAFTGPNLQEGNMAFDAKRGVVVWFGGKRGNGTPPLNETWEWNGDSWRLVLSGGPSPRTYPAMTFDHAAGRVILFGGEGQSTPQTFGDTWTWNGIEWQLQATTGPHARSSAAMAFDHSLQRPVMFGGSQVSGMNETNETWSWTGSAWMQEPTWPSPASRRATAIVFDTARGELVLFGGYSGMPGLIFGDTWRRRNGVWQEADFGNPQVRRSHSMAFDSDRGRTVMFGGNSDGDANDTWEYETATHQWHHFVTPGPSRRNWSALAFDRERHVTVLFGGSTLPNGNIRGDTWEWNGIAWSQRFPQHAPSPRAAHAMAYDEARQVVVLHGAHTYGSDISRETWEWNGDDWALRSATGPSAGGGHAMAYDRDRQVTVLFGGTDQFGHYSSDTWEWNGSTWSLRSTTGPIGRTGHTMVYDTDIQRTVLLGGWPDLPRGVWTWDGAIWQRRNYVGPINPYRHAMAFDSIQGVAIMNGGDNTSKTWELDLHLGPVTQLGPHIVEATIGNPASFHVSATGSEPLQYQWRRAGVPLVDGPHVSGVNTPTLTVIPQSFGDQLVYDAMVWDDTCVTLGDPTWLNVVSNGDINNDGVVDVTDLLAVLAQWTGNATCGVAQCSADVAEDNRVNTSDLTFVINLWNR